MKHDLGTRVYLENDLRCRTFFDGVANTLDVLVEHGLLVQAFYAPYRFSPNIRVAINDALKG